MRWNFITTNNMVQFYFFYPKRLIVIYDSYFEIYIYTEYIITIIFKQFQFSFCFLEFEIDNIHVFFFQNKKAFISNNFI